MKSRFLLDQVHAHWGPNNVIGSEHMIDRYQYAGELHFVHWNREKCEFIDTAAVEPDGLAVIGVFLKVIKKTAEKLHFFTDRFFPAEMT